MGEDGAHHLCSDSTDYEAGHRAKAATKVVTHMPRSMVTAAGIALLTPLEYGVDATWRLVADPSLAGVSGVFFNQASAARPDGQALDADDRRALRELSVRLTGV